MNDIPIELYKKENGDFVKFVRYEEIERLQKENEELKEHTKILAKISEKRLERYLRLQNIIKEAKEYIKGACWLDEVNKPNSLGHKQTMKVFEILDKENK